MKYYRIYSKMKDQKRFKGVDWAEGTQVNKLIYATIVDEPFVEKAKDVLTKSAKLNPGLTLQLREIESQKVIFEITNEEN